MNIRSFQYFITIWEKPTLSAAADALYISQPALSQQIKKIEEEVGAQLFTRKGHTMSLTPAGEVFLLCSRRILQFYEAMQREVKMLSVAEKDTVHMGISPFYSQHYLPKILPPFLQKHPQINVDIVEEISVNLENRLLKGELDFCALPLYPKNELLEYETIYHEKILLAVPKDHPVNSNYPTDALITKSYPFIDLALMKNEPFIGLKKIQKFSAIGLRLCKEAGFAPRTICETMNWETVHLLIASGLGVGFVPEILIGNIKDPETCPCYYQLSSPAYRDYALVHRPGAILSDAANILQESLREFFREI